MGNWHTKSVGLGAQIPTFNLRYLILHDSILEMLPFLQLVNLAR